MAGFELQISNLVVITTLVAIVIGIVFALFWFFKRSENLTDEDRLHIERSKVGFLAAIALAILTLTAMKKEKSFSISLGGGRSSASLL